MYKRQVHSQSVQELGITERICHEEERFLSDYITAEPEPISTEEIAEKIIQLKSQKAPIPVGVTNSPLLRFSER